MVFYRTRRASTAVAIFPLLADAPVQQELWHQEGTTEYTEWQCPLPGVHSIMMVKLAQIDVGGAGALPPPFTISNITSKVVVYAPAEWADSLLQGLLKMKLSSGKLQF